MNRSIRILIITLLCLVSGAILGCCVWQPKGLHMNSLFSKLPRNQAIAGWQPMRDASQFVCKHELDVAPPIDPESQRWVDEALYLTRKAVWKEERNYPKAFELYQKAAERGNWKGMILLADMYMRKIPAEPEKAVQLIEQMMTMGVPHGYYLMGVLYAQGQDVPLDYARSYAFLGKAADMGSPVAQTYLANQLFYAPQRANNKTSWSNVPLGMKMLECAYEQQYGGAAYKLRLVKGSFFTISREEELVILQNGVKWGSEDCADSISAMFLAKGGRLRDSERLYLYDQFSTALRLDKYLRFPNLDQVVPLPPAKVPPFKKDHIDIIQRAQDPSKYNFK